MRRRADAYAAQAQAAALAGARVMAASNAAAAVDVATADVAGITGGSGRTIAAVNTDISTIQARLTAAGIP